jgi:hypothetical protein
MVTIHCDLCGEEIPPVRVEILKVDYLMYKDGVAQHLREFDMCESCRKKLEAGRDHIHVVIKPRCSE